MLKLIEKLEDLELYEREVVYCHIKCSGNRVIKNLTTNEIVGQEVFILGKYENDILIKKDEDIYGLFEKQRDETLKFLRFIPEGKNDK